MNNMRKSLIASAVVLGLSLAATAAHADIIVQGSVNGGAVTTLFSGNANTTGGFTGMLGGYDTVLEFALGQNAFAGNGGLLDVTSTVNCASSACVGTSLKLWVTETNINSPSNPVALFTQLSSPSLLNLTASRTMYFDAANTGAEGTSLATSWGTPVQTTTNVVPTGGNPAGSQFSLTEEIDLTATSVGGTLSADDQVSVPEPAALSLLGLGLTAVAFLRRRQSV